MLTPWLDLISSEPAADAVGIPLDVLHRYDLRPRPVRSPAKANRRLCVYHLSRIQTPDGSKPACGCSIPAHPSCAW